MSYKVLVASAVLVLSLGVGAFAQQKPQPTTQPAMQPAPVKDGPVLCPVTNQPVDRKIVTRFRGKWVYFATPDALKKFEADPDKYAEGVQAQWAATKPLRIQVKCPVTGERANPEFFTGQGEDAIYFSSADAKAKWEKDSKPFEKRLEADCYTFQTICPVSGNVIDPASSKTVGDRTVYFCCDGCLPEFTKNQAEYMKNVDEQVRTNKSGWITHQLEDKLGKVDKTGSVPAGKPKP